jgi:hypothetical protein
LPVARAGSLQQSNNLKRTAPSAHLSNSDAHHSKTTAAMYGNPARMARAPLSQFAIADMLTWKNS